MCRKFSYGPLYYDTWDNIPFFKRPYIINPQVTPKTLIIKAASEITSALNGTVSRDVKMAEALERFSKLFTKIAVAKAATANAKEQQNNLPTHPNARQAVLLPRVVDRPLIPAGPLPRVPVTPAEADCHVEGVGGRVQIVGTASHVAILPMQIVENLTPQQGKHGPPITRPNYISQDEDDEPQYGYNTRSRMTSIMQEAMLACINITKPTFKISVAELAIQRFPVT